MREPLQLRLCRFSLLEVGAGVFEVLATSGDTQWVPLRRVVDAGLLTLHTQFGRRRL